MHNFEFPVKTSSRVKKETLTVTGIAERWWIPDNRDIFSVLLVTECLINYRQHLFAPFRQSDRNTPYINFLFVVIG